MSNHNLELAQKAFKKVERDMDLMHLIKKIKEIDKLKNFLFDEHQKVLFEFLPREVIKHKHDGNINERLSLKKLGQNFLPIKIDRPFSGQIRKLTDFFLKK